MPRISLLVVIFWFSCAVLPGLGAADDRLDRYTRAIEENPNDPWAHVNRGDHLKILGEYDRAIADYSRAIELDPKHIAAFNNRGVAYAQKGEYHLALADYGRIIELDPQSATAYGNRGGLYADMGEYDRAIVDLGRAIELSPREQSAYYNRGNVWAKKGEYELAIADYSRAIELWPKYGKAYRGRGHVFLFKGDFVRAGADFFRAAERDPNGYTIIFRYLALARQGENAVAELQANAGRLQTKEWPYSVIELYLGKQGPDALFAAAAKPAERCEAHFYVGQWAILQNKPAEAEAHLRSAVETCPKEFLEYRGAQAELRRPKPWPGHGQPALVTDDLEILNRGAVELYRQGKYKEAADSLNAQVIQLADRAEYEEATAVAEKAVTLAERTLGPDYPLIFPIINNLAQTYQALGRYDEAEPLYRRAMAGNERLTEDPGAFLSVDKRGAEHVGTLAVANNLAELYRAQGRDGEAEPLLKRALAGRERVLGHDHPDTLKSANNLAALYQAQGHHGEAEPLYKRTLAAKEHALGAEHRSTLSSVANLATLFEDQGRYSEAEALYRRALAGREQVLGPEHPETLNSVNNLGLLYHRQGRHGQAESLYQRALAAKERVLGPEHPDTLLGAHNLAGLSFERLDWPRAAALWRRTTGAIARRTQRSAQTAGQPMTGERKSEAVRFDLQFQALVKVVSRLAADGREPAAEASREMFQVAQSALSSEAARSLSQMAARSARGDARLSALIRERQDLATEWQKNERLRNAALGQEAAKRDANSEAQSNARIAAIETRIAAIDKSLSAKFPDYTVLASLAPLPVEEVQAQLGANEALVLFLDTVELRPLPEETFLWVVTRTDVRWVRSDLGKAALAREVQAVRCGLDSSAWTDAHCKELTGTQYTEVDYLAGKPLPFDHARAHRLYTALFGQVQDLIGGKHLLLVPSGPLTQLPFQTLVTAPPSGGDHRDAEWLARGHALSVLPAVSSLKALRATGRASAAAKPVIGFGNPLLTGPDASYAKSVQLTQQKQSCPKSPWQQAASLFGLRRGTAALETRGGLANVSLIRAQAPLPETADELCAVARETGADGSEMRLGARATEREVKAMSARGELTQYRIVYFATHGAMAGELKGSAEPGLILTPPETASEEDDGYLSASEIAGLKLDADWVILSACNTAAGDAATAEALSGLARAFIYAQARALLVSHWAVYSDATVKLITAAIRETAHDESLGRAEALRRAMLALVDRGEPHEAHPAYWAPFVVVGEGAPR